MPARETQASSRSRAEPRFVISAALMPALVQERARRRDELLKSGAPGVAVYRGPGTRQVQGTSGSEAPPGRRAADADNGAGGGIQEILRVRHCVIRSMAEHFIVPLSQIDGPTDSELTIVRNYEVIDVVTELHQGLKGSEDLLKHRLPLPPNRDESDMDLDRPGGEGASHQNGGPAADPALAASTLDLWLAPRLLSAAAMLTARVAEVQQAASTPERQLQEDTLDDMRRLIELQKRIIEFLQDLLAMSVLVHGAVHVHFMCEEFHRVAAAALQAARFEGDSGTADSVTFYAGAHQLNENLRTISLPSRCKVPMSEAWLPEDQSPFKVSIIQSISSSRKKPHKRSLFYAQALLSHSAILFTRIRAHYPLHLALASNHALDRFQNEWRRDHLDYSTHSAHRRPPPGMERLRYQVLRQLADQALDDKCGADTHHFLLLTSDLFGQAFVRDVLTDAPFIGDMDASLASTLADYYQELRATLRQLRKALRTNNSFFPSRQSAKARELSGTLLPILRRCLPAFLEIAGEGWEHNFVGASAVQFNREDKVNKAIEIYHKNCAFEAIMFVLDAVSPLHTQSISAEMETLEKLCGEDINGTAMQQAANGSTTAIQELDEHPWLSREDRVQLTAAVQRYRKLKAMFPPSSKSVLNDLHQGPILHGERSTPAQHVNASQRPIRSIGGGGHKDTMRLVTLRILEETWDSECPKIVSRGPEQLISAVELVSKAFCAASGTLFYRPKSSPEAFTFQELRCSKCDSINFAVVNPESDSVDSGSDTIRRSCSKAGYSTVLRLLENVATTLPSNEKAAVLLDGVRRAFAHGGESLLLDHALRPTRTVIFKGLRHSAESARTAAIRLCAVVVRQAFASQVITARTEIIDAVEQVVETALNLPGKLRAKATSLMLACHLSQMDNISMKQRGLTLLAHTLNAPDILGDLALDYLLQVQKSHDKTIFQLLQPHINVIAPPLLAQHARDKKALNPLLQVLDQSLDTFIRTTMNETLPSLVAEADEEAVEMIANVLKIELHVLVLDGASPFIMAHIMSLGPKDRDRGLAAILRIANKGRSGIQVELQTVVRGTLTDVLGKLLLMLSDDRTKDNAWNNLLYVERIMRPTGYRASTDAQAAADLIDRDILAVQDWLTGQLMGRFGKRTLAQRCQVLRGLGALIEVAGSLINPIRPQILTAFTSALATKELRLDALRAWSKFFFKLPFEDVAPVVGQTAAVMLDWWAEFAAHEKDVATHILRYAVLVHNDSLGKHADNIPSLDALETEIPDIARKLRSSRIRQAHEEVLGHILARVGSDNSSISYHSLLDLLSFMRSNRAWIESLTSGNKFGTSISDIVSTVMTAAARMEDEHSDAKNVCLQCLGVLGAIDPDRFEQGSDEQTRTILKDFDDKDESAEFGIYLLQHVLVSAFRHAIDAAAQQCYAFAIQEMLKYCEMGRKNDRGGPPSVTSKDRWKAIPASIKDTLEPLSTATYRAHVYEWDEVPSPLYKNVSSYRKWLIQWARQLTDLVSKPAAKAFFTIVGQAITDSDIQVARFILPHLVLHLLIWGPEQCRSEIRSEIIAVLNDQVDDQSTADEDRRQQSAQMVFQLLDHLNVYIRRKRLETIHKTSRKVRQADASEALVNVESILASIAPELMARASLRCKSYARALLSFESRVRVLKKEAGKADGEIQEYYANMHEIYASVDEPDGMEGVSTKILNPTLEHQIREHEMTGRWTSAQSCWEVKLQQEPESLDSQIGLLRCLRSLGHFDNLRTHIRGILTRHPEWRNALAAYTLESAWSLGEWDDVADAVQHVEDPLPEHGIGKAFLCMRGEDKNGFKAAVQEARDLVGKPIFSAGSAGYPQIVDSVTQLHMLHELEMIQAIPKAARQGSGQVTDLLSSLRSRLQSSVPSFRSREALLSLRRSAFGVRVDIPDLVAEVGRCWTTTSKIARKAGHLQTAYSAVLQAIREKAPFAFVQNAKLLASNGEVQHALREVETTLQSKVFRLPGTDTDTAGGTAANAIDLTDSPNAGTATETNKLSAVDVAKACLLRARLMELAGRFESNDIIARYKQSSRVDSKAEKSWYFLGRYYDSLRDAPLAVPMQHKGFVVRFFLKAAMSGTKYFYRTMPRIATIWLDAGEDPALVKASRSGRPIEKSESLEGYQKQELFQQMNDRIRKVHTRVPAYQWYGIFPQLVSRVIHKNENVWQVLSELIASVVKTFPEQAMWSMVAGAQSKEEERSKRMMRILNRVKADAKRDGHDGVETIVDRSRGLAEQLLNLCELSVKSASSLSLSHSIPSLGDRTFRNLLIPLQDSIVINLPTDFSSRADHQSFPTDSPRIRSFEERIEIMSSLQKPRKIGIKAFDGRVYNFLCKPKDDLRKDARLMEFDSMINKFLQSNAESRRRRLHIRTYAVVTLNEECGFIEWVPNTVGFRNILTTLYTSKGISLYTPDVKPHLDEARICNDNRRSAEIFETRLLTKYPAVFHEWFLATFSEPSAWMKARLSYARTAAVMSMVGWVLGLGDRHGENILFDASSGDTVHVDFNCLFEKGQTFEIPERVPFRLTQNMVDALGVTGVEGVYRRACEITMSILRENKDSLMSVLDAMIHDPLVDFGTADEGKKKRHSTSTNADRPDPRVVAARQNLAPIERKLEGFMVSKLDTRPMPSSAAADHGFVSATASTAAATSGVIGGNGRYGGAAGKGPSSGFPTNELVEMLIREATSSLLLSKMYVGWAPYL